MTGRFELDWGKGLSVLKKTGEKAREKKHFMAKLEKYYKGKGITIAARERKPKTPRRLNIPRKCDEKQGRGKDRPGTRGSTKISRAQ